RSAKTGPSTERGRDLRAQDRKSRHRARLVASCRRIGARGARIPPSARRLYFSCGRGDQDLAHSPCLRKAAAWRYWPESCCGLRRRRARRRRAAARGRQTDERRAVPARPPARSRRALRVKATASLAQALRDAARMVARVASGRSLADESMSGALLDLTHGTLRRYGRVQAIVDELSRRGRPDALVEALLWCSLYALESGRYAEYTVVDQAVRACALLERWSAKGYVNALLRWFLRERASLEARIGADMEARYQHPRWWIE